VSEIVGILWGQAREAFEEQRLEEGTAAWLDAFERAPYFSPLVQDLLKKGLRDPVMGQIKKAVTGPRRKACLLALSALDPDPRARLSWVASYRATAPFAPPLALVDVWEAVSLVESAVERANRRGGRLAPRDPLALAVERLLSALALDPFEDLAYRRLGLYVQEQGALHLKFAWRLGPALVELVQAYRLMEIALRPPAAGPRPPGSASELLARARGSIEAAARLEGDTPRVRYLRGLLAFHARDFKAAIEALEPLGQMEPKPFNPVFTLARAYLDAGRPEKGIPLFADIPLWRVEPGAYHNLALCLGRMGLASQAREAYESALALNPDYLPALLNHAATLAEEGDLSQARALLEGALRARPGDPMLLGHLGQLLMRLGDQEKAAGCLREALAASPDDVGTRVALAYVLARREDYSEAFNLLRPYLSRGQGGDRAARAAFRRILETRFYKAEDHEIDGRTAYALREYREVLRLLPHDDPLRKLVERRVSRLEGR
jgi:tetratricopeptide (TPR) repeat protein